MKTLLLKSLKALLLCFCLLCITSSFSFSQEKKGHYQGEVNLGLGMGAKYENGEAHDGVGIFQLNTIHGIRYNDYWFIGAGTGINFAGGQLLQPQDHMTFTYGSFGFPLYANIKGYLPLGKKRIVSLIGSLDAGAVQYLYSKKKPYKVSHFQLFASPQIGLDFKLGQKYSIYVTVGYRYEFTSQLGARLGFTF